MQIKPDSKAKLACEKAGNKWLILAYSFNIDGNAASQTITDRIPTFLNDGIKPVVISAPTGKKDCLIPHYQIFSAAPSGILFEIRHIINAKYKSHFLKEFLKALLLVLLLPFYILEKFFIHLDSHWSWHLSAFFKGAWAVRKHKPDIIYSTAGPSCTHWAGYLISKAFGLPWLVELHDPLINDTNEKKWQFYYFKRWLEKTIVKHASAIIFFTNSALESARKRNNNFENGFVIRPGATNIYAINTKYTPGAKMHFGHFGALTGNRNLKIFIKALFKIFSSNPDLRSKVILDVYGANLDDVSQKAIEEYPLGEALQVHGRLEYDPKTRKTGRQQVFEAMHRQDILLLLHGEGVMCKEYIPSKTYEYLLTDRPILGLVEPKSELDLILRQDNHIIVDGNNMDAVKKAILTTIRLWESNRLPHPANELSYRVENAAKKIENIATDIFVNFSAIKAEKLNSSKSFKKILIIIRRSLGDVLATSPMINAIYEYDTETQIDLLVNKNTKGIAKCIKHVSKVLCYDYDWWNKGIGKGLINEFLLLKKISKKYDLAISLTANERSTIYSIMSGRTSIAATDVILENSWWRKAFLSDTYKFAPDCHIVLNNLATIKTLGIPVEKINLSACYPKVAGDNIRRLLDAAKIDKFIIFHPSARYEYKVYPRKLRNKLLTYLNNIGVPIVITGGGSNIDLHIAAELPELKNIYNFIGKTTLEEAIALTDHSLGYIGMDTFNMHIAAAFNKKIVAIFGPTLPQIWSPWSNSLQTHARDNNEPIQRYGDISLIRADHGCVSCGLAGCNDSNYRSKCLHEISPEIIFKEVQLRWPAP